MSDQGLTTDSAPETAAIPMPAADDPLAAPLEDQSTFSRSYVEKIRGEAQRYREQASTASSQLQGYNDVFGAYEPDDQKAWLDLARTWAQDPAQAATVMQQIAQSVLGDPGQVGQEDWGPQDVEQAVDQLTPEQVQQMIEDSLAQRDATVAEQRAVDSIFAEVRAAGYDPESAEGFSVLYNANHHTGGDIDKAVEMMKARDQKIIDEYIAGRTGGNRPRIAPSGGVAATSAVGPITNLDEARKATEAFLRERRAAQ